MKDNTQDHLLQNETQAEASTTKATLMLITDTVVQEFKWGLQISNQMKLHSLQPPGTNNNPKGTNTANLYTTVRIFK